MYLNAYKWRWMSDGYTGRDAGMPNPPVGRHQAHIWEESDAPSRRCDLQYVNMIKYLFQRHLINMLRYKLTINRRKRRSIQSTQVGHNKIQYAKGRPIWFLGGGRGRGGGGGGEWGNFSETKTLILRLNELQQCKRHVVQTTRTALPISRTVFFEYNFCRVACG